jgi:hypothetical protein
VANSIVSREKFVHFGRYSLVLTGLFVTVIAAQAGPIIIASGAGPLPGSAEDLSGFQVGEIQGSLSGTDPNDVSVFALNILNAADFSAMTINAGPHGIPDTELFLFNSAGSGVYFNDDISGSDTLSCLPSSDAFNPCPSASGGLGPLADGLYYLAITRSFNGPVDNLFNEIFTNRLSTDVVGPNAGVGAIAGWDGTGNASPNFDSINYDIVLSGTDTPEPATWTMVLGAALVFVGACYLPGRKRFFF